MNPLSNLPKIAVTPGEPGGIGIDILLHIAQQAWPAHFYLFADPEVFFDRASFYNLNIEVENHQLIIDQHPTTFYFVPFKAAYPKTTGQAKLENVEYVIQCLNQAIEDCLSKKFTGLVTGPIQKSIINEKGIIFSGHTEWIAQKCQVEQVVMMLMNKTLKVALATTHLPLRKVPDAITETLLLKTMDILIHDLQKWFNLTKPKIRICGLNPHAGEAGHLGTEELEIIIPAIKKIQQLFSAEVTGPVPGDTAFLPESLDQTDAILAMYHDQGLAAIKALGFSQAINITLGLPFFRTSVDHGTALHLAGKPGIDVGSFTQALQWAIHFSHSKG